MNVQHMRKAAQYHVKYRSDIIYHFIVVMLGNLYPKFQTNHRELKTILSWSKWHKRQQIWIISDRLPFVSVYRVYIVYILSKQHQIIIKCMLMYNGNSFWLILLHSYTQLNTSSCMKCLKANALSTCRTVINRTQILTII